MNSFIFFLILNTLYWVSFSLVLKSVNHVWKSHKFMVKIHDTKIKDDQSLAIIKLLYAISGLACTIISYVLLGNFNG